MVDYTPEYLKESADRANAGMIAYFREKIPKMLAEHHSSLPDLSRAFQMTNDPEAYINGGFMDRIGGLFTPEDREFILETAEKFERVKLGFAYFSLISSTRRPLEAIRLSNYQLRTGWQKTGVPLGFNETVGGHLATIKNMAFLLFFDDPDIALIEEISSVHDVGESVIGDFTPVCPISRADKGRIEMLGIHLICKHTIRMDDNPFAKMIHRAVTLYDGTDSAFENVRSKVRDCDLLEMCSEALFLMANAPESERPTLNHHLQDFWDYVGERLTNKRAKDFFESLSTSRYRLDLDKASYIAIFMHAHQYMVLIDPNCLETNQRFQYECFLREFNERKKSHTGFERTL